MNIKRYEPRKKTNPFLIGCGCLIIGVLILGAGILLSLLLFAPQVQSIVLQVAGLENLGDVETVLNSTAIPVPRLENPQTVLNVQLQEGDYSQTLTGSGEGYSVLSGEVAGQMQLQISFDETALLAQCRQFSPICANNTTGIRNASFELKPNAVIIQGEFELQANFWQEAALVMQIQNANRLSVLGLEVNGQIYAIQSQELNALINETETQLNQLLQSMSAQSGMESYQLESIITDESRLTLVMR